MSRVDQFAGLSRGDQLRLVAATGLLLVTWGGVIAFSFDRFRCGLLGAGRLGERVLPGTPDPERVARIVDVADRHVPGDRKCLVRSLVTETLLNAYGYEVDHRIGVDRATNDGIEAHSWIEYEGEILIGQLENIERFEPLPPLDGRPQP